MERKKSREKLRVDVQAANESDVAGIQKLCYALMQHVKQWSTTLDANWALSEEGGEYICSSICEDTSVVLKAVISDQIAGFAIGSVTEKPYRQEQKFADIDFFYVDPKFRKHGVGSALMQGFSDWCKQQDVQVMRVETTYSNAEGQSFYQKMGFHNYELVLEKRLQ